MVTQRRRRLVGQHNVRGQLNSIEIELLLPLPVLVDCVQQFDEMFREQHSVPDVVRATAPLEHGQIQLLLFLGNRSHSSFVAGTIAQAARAASARYRMHYAGGGDCMNVGGLAVAQRVGKIGQQMLLAQFVGAIPAFRLKLMPTLVETARGALGNGSARRRVIN